MFLLLAGGLLIILLAVVIAVVSSVVSAVAAWQGLCFLFVYADVSSMARFLAELRNV